ncbi:MAG: hypothetical protein JNK46_02365 [Methylobacteriaceae bacterium]|nr:hypothetical protein [Methylobacteriaceae bacterium]
MQLSFRPMAVLLVAAGSALAAGTAEAGGRSFPGGVVIGGRGSFAPLGQPGAQSAATFNGGRVLPDRGAAPWRGYTTPNYGPGWSMRDVGRHGWRGHHGHHGHGRVIVAAGADVTNSRSFVEPPLAPSAHIAVTVQPQIVYLTPPPRKRQTVTVVYGTQRDARARAATAAPRVWRDRDGRYWRED